jgi:hypothetical protein
MAKKRDSKQIIKILNLNKMKKLKHGVLFLALVGIAVVSCEKNETPENDELLMMNPDNRNMNSNQEVTIEWNSNGGNNVWSSNDFSDEISWLRTGSSNSNFDATVFIGEMESDSIRIISKSSNSLSYSYDGQIYQMSNIAISGNILQTTVQGPNSISTNMQIEDPSGEFISEFNNLAVNDIIDIGFGDDQEFACPWCLVWAGASLIAAIVDASCSYIIQQDVAACTSNGKCSVVHSCSATCIAC